MISRSHPLLRVYDLMILALFFILAQSELEKSLGGLQLPCGVQKIQTRLKWHAHSPAVKKVKEVKK